MPENRPLYILDLSLHSPDDGVYVDVAPDALAADPHGARALFGARFDDFRTGRSPMPPNVLVPSGYFESTIPALLASGRTRVRRSAHNVEHVAPKWDGGAPWRLELAVDADAAAGAQTLTGTLARTRPDGSSQSMSLDAPLVLHPAGLLYANHTLARFDHGGAYLIAATLRNVARVPLADGELPELLETLYVLAHPPHIALPSDFSIGEEVEAVAPRPALSIAYDPSPWQIATPVLTLGFLYGDARVDAHDPRDAVFDKARVALVRRNPLAESEARARLIAAGAREGSGDAEAAAQRHAAHDGAANGSGALTIPRARLGPLILELVREGWRVEAGGVRYRAPGAARAVVRSGIDWFDLDMTVDYDGATASLPALVDALRKRQSTVKLSDGSVGLVPVEWLARLGPALAAGSSAGADVTRFTRSQIGLLDALLAAMPEASVDETFARARAKLEDFAGVRAADPAPSFAGTLREYQREGLGWLCFLRDFGLGGCLADDMGLGKTVQVLALLDWVRASRVADGRRTRPSLIVVPRSLVFNWLREAERFTPALRVLDFSGPRRRASADDLMKYDVVLTTYGMLRSDIGELAAVDFEYAVLDEAQAIKNANTASAKAARLIRARHRLALSGTPIENRLEELWSLFEFLNPGMLGTSSSFSLMAGIATDEGLEQADLAGHEILRRALRPVILRRTKQQVAPELPERIEQTLYVDLEPPQRAFYMQLLAETRRTVFAEVDRVGVSGARMHILTALLRLRQAACHPVLVDHTRPNLPSAKLDALIPTLTEIVDEGHKAVVFSQFTSFLALVRRRLDDERIPYEYLDGATRDRERRVDHFQSDDGPPVFLISLKAGGHGLNLTAADYVYLLDPWWNPAVEAQAIDRAHRIGQTRAVMATRLVAKATIEEKVLELQASKRALADAILGADQGILAGIGREELEMLLSSD